MYPDMLPPSRPARPSGSLMMLEEEHNYHSSSSSRDVQIPVMLPSANESPELYDGKASSFITENDDNTLYQSSREDLTTSNPTKAPNPFHKPIRFWLIFGSLMAVTCLTAVDMTIISTTLPTIVEDLPASNISGSWVTSSFLLTTTAFQPFMGGLSDVVGRRIAIVIAVFLFMGGSALAAKAETMLILVIGRGVQGIGGGGIQTIAEIVLSDLTTLRERGIFVGLVSLVFAVATFIAPVLGGFFSEHNWRLVFWINLPIGAVSLALIIPTMKLKTPTMPFWAKIHRMDIGANLILLASVVAILIALTEGGITHPWSSWKIWVPFTTGWLGMILFFAIEFIPNRFSPDPVLPRRLFANRTAATCFLMTFIHGLLTYGLIYLLPIYFQSVKSSSPLRSAVQIFPATAPGPFSAILAGILMASSGKYRLQIWIWWSITLAGCGLLCLLDSDTPTYQWVLFQLVPGFGVGALFTLTLPPIQASLPVEELAHATATFAFCRSFGSVWGIALGTNVFISVVNTKLANIQGLSQIGLTGSTALGFTTNLQKLPEQFQLPAQNAFMSAIRTSIYVFCPAAFLGLMISFFVDELPLPDFNESQHGMQDEVKKGKAILDENCDKTTVIQMHSQPTIQRMNSFDPSSEKKINFDTMPNMMFTPAIPAHHLRNRSLQRMSTVDSIGSQYTLQSITETLYAERSPYRSRYAL
ncbi:hypothetical protein L7F22_019324 [Adiantum nelumboides]|nr:hypothetical protein [Adiantum nelumboides]